MRAAVTDAVRRLCGLCTGTHVPVGSEETLRRAAVVLTKAGDDFLPAVVREMAMMFDAELAFVAECVGQDHLQTLAVWRGNALEENRLYARSGTPAEQLTLQEAVYHQAVVRHRFPLDPLLQDLVAEGYVALPLVGAKGDLVGAMVAITQRPLEETHDAMALLQVLAGRVTAELERASTARELSKNERYLRQVQRVEAIGWLAGNIAHDFKNLLMIVIGYGEILQERHASQELSELLAASRRASTLTKQLLAFGRRQVMQVQRVDINRVVAQVQPMLTRVMSAQVRVITSLDPALPSVEVDPGQLEQVVVNLAINARDAMPEGGTLPSVKILLACGYPHKDAGEQNQIDSTLPMLGKPFSPTSIENAVRELLDAPKR